MPSWSQSRSKSARAACARWSRERFFPAIVGRMAKTAAALIIGNEILTGKVAEQNVFVMARELFALGVELRRIVVCADEMTTIVAAT